MLLDLDINQYWDFSHPLPPAPKYMQRDSCWKLLYKLIHGKNEKNKSPLASCKKLEAMFCCASQGVLLLDTQGSVLGDEYLKA